MPHLTPETAQLVRQSWSEVIPIADAAASLFYRRLFMLDPELRHMFAHTDMVAQRTKLIATITAFVDALDNLDRVIPTLQALGKQHAGYGVTSDHYDTVGGALLWTLEQGLGPAFTLDVRAAWAVTYALVATTMSNAADNQALAPAA